MDVFKGENADYTYLISYNESIIKLYVQEKSKQSNLSKRKFEMVKVVFDDYKKKFKNYKNFIEIMNKIIEGQDEDEDNFDEDDGIVKIQFKKKSNNNILKNLVFQMVNIEKNKKKEIIFEKEIWLLNVEYYFTIGMCNERINPKPYYTIL